MFVPVVCVEMWRSKGRFVLVLYCVELMKRLMKICVSFFYCVEHMIW